MNSHRIYILTLIMAGQVPPCAPAAQPNSASKENSHAFDYFTGIGPFIFGTPLTSYDRTHWKHFKGAFEHMYFPIKFPNTLGKGKLDSLLVVFVDSKLAGLEAQINDSANIRAVEDHLSVSLGKPAFRGGGPYQDVVWTKSKSEIILRRRAPEKAILLWLH